ncbi:Uncharacterised protein [Vibrio cholerae]|uniref:Uncharacterized protein n=1 Tax=Vibrio cholerae TaxID=666 RepID=A0A655W3T7_VIBCL|nr:Uncharacterised protein [Vibrio cholerae]
MPHHRDLTAFVSTCVAEHITHITHLNRIIEEVFCDVFRAQRITRHQYNVSEITHLRINMWSCHVFVPLVCWLNRHHSTKP